MPAYIVGVQVSADVEISVDAPDEEIAKDTAQRLVESAEIFDLGAVNTEVWGIWVEGSER